MGGQHSLQAVDYPDALISRPLFLAPIVSRSRAVGEGSVSVSVCGGVRATLCRPRLQSKHFFTLTSVFCRLLTASAKSGQNCTICVTWRVTCVPYSRRRVFVRLTLDNGLSPVADLKLRRCGRNWQLARSIVCAPIAARVACAWPALGRRARPHIAATRPAAATANSSNLLTNATHASERLRSFDAAETTQCDVYDRFDRSAGVFVRPFTCGDDSASERPVKTAALPLLAFFSKPNDSPLAVRLGGRIRSRKSVNKADRAE